MIGQIVSHYRLKEQFGPEEWESYTPSASIPGSTLTATSNSNCSSCEGARRRFGTETLGLAKMNHRNIATVHEFGNQADTDYLVTENIPGITLDAKLKQVSLAI